MNNLPRLCAAESGVLPAVYCCIPMYFYSNYIPMYIHSLLSTCFSAPLRRLYDASCLHALIVSMHVPPYAATKNALRWVAVAVAVAVGVGVGSQVGVDGDGQPHLAEMTAEGVSYEPVGAVGGLADDAMEHGGMRDLATVSRVK